MKQSIIPELLLKDVLLKVQQPARYLGGEFQLTPIIPADNDLRVGLCFPDLYEIGMSNTALRILYDLINRIEGVTCERVFAPAPDFEQILRTRAVPLYTLETGLPLSELDILCFTVGYELSAASILTVLDLGGIPIRGRQRKDGDPIVLAGGPAITNPLPFGEFIDAVYLGEAEKSFSEIISCIRDMVHINEKRERILERIRDWGCIWTKGSAVVRRAVHERFTEVPSEDAAAGNPPYSYFTVPTLRPVQDNGVVEIMRGCPNGCRFCHAGELYKPFRQRSANQIQLLADQLIHQLGYRDITLSSLSSGDHPQILDITKRLTERYQPYQVSISLPSLKVETFSLPVLDQISSVRRSGLTFAVETPSAEWQKSINKEVQINHCIAIIEGARRLGWKVAKFYFMTGLPFVDPDRETVQIVQFLETIQKKTGIQLNIAIGTFIPKPHTPFQWAPFLPPAEALDRLLSLKRSIQAAVKKVKVSFQDPMISFIEAIICRGDERAGELIISAYHRGARLDAWDEYLNKAIWEKVCSEQDWNVEEETCRSRSLEETLPWADIRLASSLEYLKSEYRRAMHAEMTPPCSPECSHHCGVCTPAKGIEPKPAEIPAELEVLPEAPDSTASDTHAERVRMQLLFQYRKTGKAIYISHIHVMHMIEKVFQRSGIQLAFTQGFNPKPVLEFLQPLPIGIEGEREIFTAAAFITLEMAALTGREFELRISELLNQNLPQGFLIDRVLSIPVNGRKPSLTAAYHTSQYLFSELEDERWRLLEALGASERNVKILHADPPNTIMLQISEPETTGSGMDASIRPSGNIMKLIERRTGKYEFLSGCRVSRTALFAGSMRDYFDLFSE